MAEGIEIPKWVIALTLIYITSCQFLLSYIIAKFLAEKKLRRVGDSVIKDSNQSSPTQYKDHYKPIHPSAITQVLEKYPTERGANKPKKDSQYKQCVFIFLGHIANLFPTIFTRVYRKLRGISTETEENPGSFPRFTHKSLNPNQGLFLLGIAKKETLFTACGDGATKCSVGPL